MPENLTDQLRALAENDWPVSIILGSGVYALVGRIEYVGNDYLTLEEPVHRESHHVPLSSIVYIKERGGK